MKFVDVKSMREGIEKNIRDSLRSEDSMAMLVLMSKEGVDSAELVMDIINAYTNGAEFEEVEDIVKDIYISGYAAGMRRIKESMVNMLKGIELLDLDEE